MSYRLLVRLRGIEIEASMLVPPGTHVPGPEWIELPRGPWWNEIVKGAGENWYREDGALLRKEQRMVYATPRRAPVGAAVRVTVTGSRPVWMRVGDSMIKLEDEYLDVAWEDAAEIQIRVEDPRSTSNAALVRWEEEQ